MPRSGKDVNRPAALIRIRKGMTGQTSVPFGPRIPAAARCTVIARRIRTDKVGVCSGTVGEAIALRARNPNSDNVWNLAHRPIDSRYTAISTSMDDSAAEVFDEFFIRNNIPLHRRRHDLSSLNPTLRDQLRAIQQSFNFALRNEKRGILGHVAHPPFHIDYVDADVESATAFRCAGYSFIAVAVSLMYSMSDVCLALSKSPEVAQALGIQHSSDDYNQLHGVMFSSLSGFIIAHEYTHHVYGHLSEDDPANLFLAGSEVAHQGKLDADHRPPLKRGVRFSRATLSRKLPFLRCKSKELVSLVAPAHVRHTACVSEAVSSHSYASICTDATKCAARSLAREFQKLIGAAAQATLGDKANQIWSKQTEFLKSSACATYIRALIAGVDKFRESIPT